jgi:hypothetical protein
MFQMHLRPSLHIFLFCYKLEINILTLLYLLYYYTIILYYYIILHLLHYYIFILFIILYFNILILINIRSLQFTFGCHTNNTTEGDLQPDKDVSTSTGYNNRCLGVYQPTISAVFLPHHH